MTLAIRSLWPACGPACGRSATLRDDIVRRTHTQAGRYRVLGYTDRMADLMRVANLFVGKPGGPPHPAQHLAGGRRHPPAGRPGRDPGRRVHRLRHDSGGGGGFGSGDPLSTVLTGADFAVLLVGVLGALTGASEYGSRMILATIAAVPRRWQIVVSKVIVLTVVVLPTALIGVLAAFGVGMGILSAGDGATVALTDDGVLRSVLGMAGYLTAIALIGLGLGILLRSAAGSIGVLIGGVIVLPTLAAALLPASLDSVLKFLPRTEP